MTTVALQCWSCKKKQGCVMLEEIEVERQICRVVHHGDTGEWCRDDLCESCEDYREGVCSDYEAMVLTRRKGRLC